MSLKNFAGNVTRTTSLALWICTAIAVGLLVASFLLPPTGIIDPSVLKAVAELFGFVILFIAREAIREGLGVTVKHGETEVHIADETHE